MSTEQLDRDLLDKCVSLEGLDEAKQKKEIASVLNHLEKEWETDISTIDSAQLASLTSCVVGQSTKGLTTELEELLLQKERIERQLDKKTHELQAKKQELFDVLEDLFVKKGASKDVISKLHSLELQSMDLLTLLEEMVESAIITTLEKGTNIEETLEELAKEITLHTLDEGILSAVRIRHIISSILSIAIDVAEATPNSANVILEGTIKGMRRGLVRAIDRFNQKFLFTPDEAKILLIDDPQSLYNELHHIDTLFIQTIENVSLQSSPEIKAQLENILADIRYDMEELTLISKEALEILGDKLSIFAKQTFEKSSTMLRSKKAQDAKKLGVHAWGVARNVLDGAIKGAKDAIDKNK
ncbi:hypothetical protein JHD50_05670 [Sulfurimonas sp. MAG313]|nr:DUF6781 family protein [Sulfurimonas sp. MAG313]MDF1880796.1 hypothetical protein [Sulfurimonas sp. MAG313]